MMIGSTII